MRITKYLKFWDYQTLVDAFGSLIMSGLVTKRVTTCNAIECRWETALPLINCCMRQEQAGMIKDTLVLRIELKRSNRRLFMINFTWSNLLNLNQQIGTVEKITSYRTLKLFSRLGIGWTWLCAQESTGTFIGFMDNRQFNRTTSYFLLFDFSGGYFVGSILCTANQTGKDILGLG